MEWAIYYDDYSRYSNEDGPWHAAPSDGVLFVVERNEIGIRFHSGCDYYVQFPDDLSVASTGELGPLLRRRPAFSVDAIKFGRWTSHACMERVRDRVHAEWR